MADEFLTQVILNVLIPCKENTILKVQREVAKMTGLEVFGMEFKYFPPLSKEVPNGR